MEVPAHCVVVLKVHPLRAVLQSVAIINIKIIKRKKSFTQIRHKRTFFNSILNILQWYATQTLYDVAQLHKTL